MTHQPAEDLTAPRPGSAPHADDTQHDTRHDTARDPQIGARADDAPRKKLLDLSLSQLLAGSMAAATAAALGSRLGVAGTITGAAVLSIVSAIAANVYTNSMARARDAVVVVRSRRLADGRVVQVATEKVATPRDAAREGSWWQRLDRATTRRLLLMAAAVFAIAAVVITVLQLTTGAQVTGTDIGTRTSVSRVPSPGSSPGGVVPTHSDATSPVSTPTTSEPATAPTTSQPVTTPDGPPVTTDPATPAPSVTAPGPAPASTAPSEAATPPEAAPAPTAP
ncbi:hypothetical protein GCM10009740_31170 [Terrabacter terrae]|uniref:Uncharacterized protein n=1 Tax=Terrabacter terrae TaxID=318434 RepID=A0ABN2UHW7_9MICO